MSLRLRHNLIITGLLLLTMWAGAALTTNSARSNVHAEVASTEKLGFYLFETDVLNTQRRSGAQDRAAKPGR